MNTFQPNNFQPGIGAVSGYGNQIAGSNYNSLLPMLQQLLQRRLGVTSIGTNGYQIPAGRAIDGYTDATGAFRPGSPGV